MSTSEPIAPDRLEALLRGEAGADGRERRMGALLDELTLGEIAPPSELRERIRALGAAPTTAVPASRRRLPRPRRPRHLAPVLGGALALAAVVTGIAITQSRGPAQTGDPNLSAAREAAPTSKPPANVQAGAAPQQTYSTARAQLGSIPGTGNAAAAPLPDAQRAQDYAATLRLAVGTVAELSRSTQTVLDTVRSLGGAVETLDYGTPSAGNGSALIALRVPVARAQEALTRFSSLGTITAQQVQIRDLQSGLDQETNRARALRHRIALLKAKLLSPALSAEDRVVLEGRLADSQTALESVLRGVHTTQQRAAFARFSLELDTGRGTAIAPPAHRGAFERTAEDALGVISVAGRGALFAAIVGGPFVLLAGGALWLARRVRRRAARRLLETS
ncbi:MAG TPA: DUF4349 domain-containing protein [Gaiellales bacterium]|jgi:hypothetical protein|nr:DUF4349 domain-containing protein [Gaiellales bacterium]